MQCSTQRFSMPTHCPAFLCRAIAQQYYSVPMQFSALPMQTIVRHCGAVAGYCFSLLHPGITSQRHAFTRLYHAIPQPSASGRCNSSALLASCRPVVQCITSSPGYGERLTGETGNLALGNLLPCETPHARISPLAEAIEHAIFQPLAHDFHVVVIEAYYL